MKVINGIYWTVLVVCFLSILGCAWISKNGDQHQAMISNYFGENTKVPDEYVELDPNAKFTFVLNYYPNEDNSGFEMLEIKITSYTDYTMQSVYSTGVQVINPKGMTCDTEETGWEWNFFGGQMFSWNKYVVDIPGEVNYFNSVDGVSFSATDRLGINEDLYIIDIEGVPYAFNFNKEVCETNRSAITQHNYTKASFEYFIYQIYGTVKSLEATKTYTNLTMRFDDIFQLYEYNSVTGKFDIQSSFGQIDDYVSFKINRYNTGAKIHEDSLFGSIGAEGKGGVIWAN